MFIRDTVYRSQNLNIMIYMVRMSCNLVFMINRATVNRSQDLDVIIYKDMVNMSMNPDAVSEIRQKFHLNRRTSNSEMLVV